MKYTITKASFIKSAQSLKDSLPPDMAEVAFLGRSNVGKSSLLNSLTQQKSLAKSSSTPGKTQLINFFEVTFKSIESEQNLYHMCRFVDLPGFGYAKVSKSLKEAWHINLTNFLQKRLSIQIFIQLIDARHPNLDIDANVEQFLLEHKRGDQIILKVFTKIDKLKQNDLAKLKQKHKDAIYISNLKKRGIQELQQKIATYLFGE
jgi:GTP-binding protein